MDLCHLKPPELAKHLPKSGGPERGDNVKDENGYKAAVTEQGASTSHMAARFLDTLPRLLGGAGEANDPISAYTQVHMSEAPRFLRLSRDRAPASVEKTTTQSTTRPVGRSRRVLPGRNLFRSSFGTTALKKKIGRSTVETQHGTRNLIGNVLTSIESCDCSKKNIKMAGKKNVEHSSKKTSFWKIQSPFIEARQLGVHSKRSRS